jgi:hypothetical protein
MIRYQIYLAIILQSFFICSAYGQEYFLKVNGSSHFDAILTATLDQDDHYYTGGIDKTIKKWDLKNGTLLKTYRLPTLGTGEDGIIVGMSFNNMTGNIAYSTVGANAALGVFNTETGIVKKVINIDGEGRYRRLAYTTDGKHLLTCGNKAVSGLTVYDTVNFQITHSDPDYDCKSLSIGPEGNFVTGAAGGYLRLYDNSFKLVKKIKTIQNAKKLDVAFGKYIAVSFGSSRPPGYIEFYEHNLDFAFSSKEAVKANINSFSRGEITSIAWSHDEEYLYAAGGVNNEYDATPTPMPLFMIEVDEDVDGLEGIQLEHMTQETTAITPYKDTFLVAGFAGDWLQLQEDEVTHYSGKNRKNMRRADLQFAKDGEIIRIIPDNPNEPIVLDFDIFNLQDVTKSSKAITFEKHETTDPSKTVAAKMVKSVESGELYWTTRMSKHIMCSSRNLKRFDSKGNLIFKKALPSFPKMYAETNKYIIIASTDDTIRWYSPTSGELLVSLYVNVDNEWIAWTPEGYFAASPKGGDLVGYHVNTGKDKAATYVTSSAIFDAFYRPDLVKRKFMGENIAQLSPLKLDQIFNKMPPTVELTKIVDKGGDDRVDVCIEATSTGGGIGEIRLFHNGKLFYSDGNYKSIVSTVRPETNITNLNSRSLKNQQQQSASKTNPTSASPTNTEKKAAQISTCYETNSTPGQNSYSVLAYNQTNTISSDIATKQYISTAPQKPSQLYIVAIGINKYKDSSANLGNAVKDSTDFISRMEEQSTTIYSKKNIHTVDLTDSQASKANILKTFSTIQKKINPEDTMIFFVASHGIMLGEQYYMVTHDYKGELEEDVLLGANEIIEFSKQNAALTQLFILDTCYAGGIDGVVNGLYDSKVSVMARKAGLHIYAAANSVEQALDEYKGNGLFTHTLLKGLNNNRKADLQNDGKVSIADLGSFSQKLTGDISSKIGHEQTPLIINYGEDNELYLLH